MAAEKRTSIRREAQEVPVPAWVSPGLAAMHANGNLRYRPVQKMPALTDKEAWKKLIGFIDKQNAEDPTAKAAMVSALKRYNLTGPFKIGGVDCYLTEPKTGIPAANNDKLLIQIHGGAYVFYAGDGCYRNSFSLSQLCQCRVLSVDYGMPPDHPFPKAIEDVLAVYLALLSTPNLIPGKQGVYKPQHLAMYGMSAGGGLAAATVLWLKDQKQPLPAVVGLYTPWVELDNIGDSRWTNQMLDLALFQHEGILGESAKLYAGGYSLKHPYVSPVYGDASGWPPTIFITGTRDLLLSDSARLHRALRNAGNRHAELHVTEGIWHIVTGLPANVPEGKSTDREMARFFARHMEGGLALKDDVEGKL